MIRPALLTALFALLLTACSEKSENETLTTEALVDTVEAAEKEAPTAAAEMKQDIEMAAEAMTDEATPENH